MSSNKSSVIFVKNCLYNNIYLSSRGSTKGAGNKLETSLSIAYNAFMSKESKEHIVPIQGAITERINAKKLHLPPNLDGRIGIDLGKTTRLMNIGGISHVFLENKEEDKRPVPQVVGFDAQKTAHFEYGRSKKRRVSQLETQDIKHGPLKGHEWRAMKIELDTQLVAESIMQRKDGSIHSAEAWIKPLNDELRNAIRKEGVSFSLKASKNMHEHIGDATTSFVSALLTKETLSGEYGSAAFSAAIILLLQGTKLRNILSSWGNYRADILYSTHIGRAFWAMFRANTAYRNLIVAMEKQDKN